MNGRLRVVLIEADGDSARAVIETALAMFAPERPAAPAPLQAMTASNDGAHTQIAAPPPSEGRRRTDHMSKGKAVIARRAKPAEAISPMRRRREHPGAPAAGGAAIEHNGVTIDRTPGAESISFNGLTTEVTAEMAKLAQLLARAMPEICDRAFLIRELALKGEWADQLLHQRTARLRAALATIGLAVITVHGQGLRLEPAA